MSEQKTGRQGIKGLDVVGIMLMLASVVWIMAFGPPQEDPLLGGYGLDQLAPLLPAVIGFCLVILARFRK
ncbi:hypothetical protein [Halomonas sp.]|uniref:hypothetical protein n=1 Tax=Halomonas sp. TaxID=1486246 RepID=UPI00298D6DDE|nr:hypothetical protein [Halomonas sp.]MDW7746565.1 hypothetical protein [Halomonas sp.]